MLPSAVASAIAADDLQALSNECLPSSLCLHAHYLWLNPKTQHLQQRTLLQVAAFHAALDTLSALLQAGVDVNAQSPDDGYSALHCACGNASSSRSSRAISFLLKCGARRELPNAHGRTPCELLTLETPQVRCLGHVGGRCGSKTLPDGEGHGMAALRPPARRWAPSPPCGPAPLSARSTGLSEHNKGLSRLRARSCGCCRRRGHQGHQTPC